MRAVNIHEAKTHLSRLIERVRRGEEITLAKAGRPVARIVPLVPRVDRRVPGTARGRITVAPDFDAPLPKDLLKRFE
ncbi:MAG: type II toxin-antitoxin system Phd/YefM family antitoxin [Candidatus Limnocylindria bacterium]